MIKQALIETAQAFATHPNLEHGDDVGFHDIETSIFADFNGSFDFGDYDHNVFYDLTITDDGAFLIIEQEVVVCGNKAAVLITYDNGHEAVAVSDGNEVEVYARFSGQRLMELIVEADGKKSRIVRENEYKEGVAPIMRVVS